MASFRPRVEPETVAPAGLGHFSIRTASLAALRVWYCTVLGARVVHETPSLAYLTYDDEHHRLALFGAAPAGQPAPPRTLGLQHVGYSFRTLRDLLGTYVRLRDSGIRPVRAVNHGPAVSLYYADPDGNHVELQVDTFRTKAEAAGYFEDTDAGSNPSGVPFNPEDFLRAYETGVSEDVLFCRPRGVAPGPLALAISRQRYRQQLRSGEAVNHRMTA